MKGLGLESMMLGVVERDEPLGKLAFRMDPSCGVVVGRVRVEAA